jgi:hypothetical protein
LNMTTPPQMRDLTQRLLTYEASAGNTSESVESTILRVYEKLRGNLCLLAGVAGFYSLASRALTLARSEAPSLSAVQVAADGNLQGMSAIEPLTNVKTEGVYEAGVTLISRLLGLLLIFLGEALTMNLVRDAWPDAALDDANPQNRRKT